VSVYVENIDADICVRAPLGQQVNQMLGYPAVSVYPTGLSVIHMVIIPTLHGKRGLMHLILSELYDNHQIVNTSVTDG
jgi:hypothetical protein